MEQFPVEVVSRKHSNWYNANMAPISAPCHIPESWGTRQLLEPSPDFLQLIPVREADEPPENTLDALADPVNYVITRGAGKRPKALDTTL